MIKLEDVEINESDPLIALIAYRIENHELQVLAIVHTSRQWPDL